MSAPVMSAPVITVYKNGDHHFMGKKLVVNRKKIRSFETFLDKVTEDTQAGKAVRKIHTPRGTKVADLANLKNGAMYVAAGPEKFKRLAYDKIGSPLSSPTRNNNIKPVLHSKIAASSRYKKEAMAEPLRNRIIYIYRNGETMSPPVKLLLDKRTLQTMDTVLQFVSNKLHLTEGYVNSLYSLETGVKVTNVTEINTNMLYVAVGTGKHFVKVKYSDNGVPFSFRHADNSKLSQSESTSTSKKSTRAADVKLVSKSENKEGKEENGNNSPITNLNESLEETSPEKKLAQSSTTKETDTVVSQTETYSSTVDKLEKSEVDLSSNNLERQNTFTHKSPEPENQLLDDSEVEKPRAEPEPQEPQEKAETSEVASSANFMETEGSLYKASGKQKETGDEVRDENAVVEQLIDAVPAVEVEEEIQEDVQASVDAATEEVEEEIQEDVQESVDAATEDTSKITAEESKNIVPDEEILDSLVVAVDESNSVKESNEVLSDTKVEEEAKETENKTEAADKDTAVKSGVEVTPKVVESSNEHIREFAG